MSIGPRLRADDTVLETATYEHNLQNRLAKVSVTVGADTTVTEYKYSTEGVRAQKIVDDGAEVKTTDHLLDAHNHTGYPEPQ